MNGFLKKYSIVVHTPFRAKNSPTRRLCNLRTRVRDSDAERLGEREKYYCEPHPTSPRLLADRSGSFVVEGIYSDPHTETEKRKLYKGAMSLYTFPFGFVSPLISRPICS